VALLEKTDAGRRPVRLLGAGVFNLESGDDDARAIDAADPRLPLE
jgi:hypothetical protein